MPSILPASLRQRLGSRPDSEHIQIVIRLLLVAAVSSYFLTNWFAAHADNPGFVELARWGVSISLVVALSLGVAMLINPGVSVTRRVVGIVHDIAAISAALYFGEAAVAGIAVVYLWVSLGNGFRYGNRYLYGSAALSILSFSTIVWFSDFWRGQMTLSVTMLVVMGLIPPYVATLLSSLHRTKALLKQQASIDVLTGLLNRAESEMAIERVLERAHDGHVLLFCDLDLFKQVNDDAGHAAGDKLLADVARIIADCAGDNNVAGRFGGDEFCVLLADATIEHARRAAEEIRNRVSGYRLAWGKQYYSVGISIGVAPTSAVRDMASLLRLADAACYAAKNAGRNQVHIVDPRTVLEDTQKIRKLFADNALAATARPKPEPCGATSLPEPRAPAIHS
jgi:diguanylate cyclase (GGDEF)-like protein